MMPVVRINDTTFTDLSTLKTWFGTNSPADTIDRIVREAMERLGIERDYDEEVVSKLPDEGPMAFNAAPSLTFTKPTSATVGGKSLHSPKWSSILHTVIAHVQAKGFKGEKLVRELSVPAKAYSYEEEGYRFFPELGISMQGQSAADAWKEIDRLAQKWRIPVDVEFVWRQNPKAMHPGKSGLLSSGKV